MSSLDEDAKNAIPKALGDGQLIVGGNEQNLAKLVAETVAQVLSNMATPREDKYKIPTAGIPKLDARGTNYATWAATTREDLEGLRPRADWTHAWG